MLGSGSELQLLVGHMVTGETTRTFSVLCGLAMRSGILGVLNAFSTDDLLWV